VVWVFVLGGIGGVGVCSRWYRWCGCLCVLGGIGGCLCVLGGIGGCLCVLGGIGGVGVCVF